MGLMRVQRVQHAQARAAQHSRQVRACGSKQSFHDIVAAAAALLSMTQDFPLRHDLQIYRCTFCHRFHLGTGRGRKGEYPMGRPVTSRPFAVIRRRVTPVEARRLLEKNEMNRPISQGMVLRYAADMQAGKWLLSGDTVKVAPDGTLLDGQHRLLAIIKANVTAELLIAQNVDKGVMHVIDTGKARTFGQQLAMQGTENAIRLGAIVRIACIALTFGLDALRHPGIVNGKAVTPTSQQLHAFLADHPELQAAVKVSQQCTLLPPSLSGTLYFLFSRNDHALAETFFTDLSHGVNLPDSHPVYVLRERLIACKASQHKKIPRVEMLVWVIKTWNAVREGKPITSWALRWTRAGKSTEAFPKIL